MLAQRRRRWTNISPALGQRFVFAGWLLPPPSRPPTLSPALHLPPHPLRSGEGEVTQQNQHQKWPPSKHETSTQCWSNVGPALKTFLTQRGRQAIYIIVIKYIYDHHINPVKVFIMFIHGIPISKMIQAYIDYTRILYIKRPE